MYGVDEIFGTKLWEFYTDAPIQLLGLEACAPVFCFREKVFGSCQALLSLGFTAAGIGLRCSVFGVLGLP